MAGKRDITAADLPPGALQDLLTVALRLCMPLYWHDKTIARPNTPLIGGSAFCLKFPEGLLLLTAAHVYRRYEGEVAANKNLVCQLGVLPVDLTKRLIVCDDDRDIATFRITEAELTNMGTRALHADDWPPPEPTAGHGLCLCGYPVSMRERLADRSAIFQAYGALPCVEYISERQIWTTFDPKRDLPTGDGVPMPPPNFNMSGCSGGIALMPEWLHKTQTWKLRPIGLIGMGQHDATTQIDPNRPPVDNIFIKRLDRLLPDGTIKPDEPLG